MESTTQIVLDSTPTTQSKASITKVAFEKWQKNLGDHAAYGEEKGAPENKTIYSSLYNTGLDGKGKTGAITAFTSSSNAISNDQIKELKSKLSTESKGTFEKATPFEALRQKSSKVFSPDSFTIFDSKSLQKILSKDNIQIALHAMEARQRAEAAEVEAQKTDVQKQNEQMMEFAGEALMAFFLLCRAGFKDIDEGVNYYKSLKNDNQKVDITTISNLEIGREMMDRYLTNIIHDRNGGEEEIVKKFSQALAGSTDAPDTKKVLELCQNLISPDDIELLNAGSKNLYRDMWQATLEETFKQSGIEEGKAKAMAEFICKKENVENFFSKGKALAPEQIKGLEAITGFDPNRGKMMENLQTGLRARLEQTGKEMLNTAKDSFAASKTGHEKKINEANQTIEKTKSNIEGLKDNIAKLDEVLKKVTTKEESKIEAKKADSQSFTSSAGAEVAKNTALEKKETANQKLEAAKSKVTAVDDKINELKQKIQDQKGKISQQVDSLNAELTKDKETLKNATNVNVAEAEAAFNKKDHTLGGIPQAINDLEEGKGKLDQATKDLNIEERKAQGLEGMNVDDLTKQMEQLINEKQAITEELNKANQTFLDADADLKAVEEGLENIKAKELKQEQEQSEITNLTNQLKSAKEEFTQAQKGLSDKIDKQIDQNNTDKAKVGELETGIEKLQKDAQPQQKPIADGKKLDNLTGTTQDKLASVGQKLTELETAKTEASTKVTEIQDQKEVLAKKVEALLKEFEGQKTALENNQKAVEDAKGKQDGSNDKANTHLNNNNYDAQDFDAQKNAIQNDINAIKAETEAQTKINSEFNPAAIDLANIEAQIQQMTTELETLNTQETKALKEQAQVEADIEATKEQQGELGNQLKQEEKKAEQEKQTQDINGLKTELATAKEGFQASKESHEAVKKTATEAIAKNNENIKTLDGKINENQIPEILKQPKGQATNTNITPTSFTDSKAGQQEVDKLTIDKTTADNTLIESKNTLVKTDKAIEELKAKIEEQKAQLEAKKQEIQTQITTDTKTLEGATGVKTEAADVANKKGDIEFDAAKGNFDTITSEIEADIQALNQGTNDLDESTKSLDGIKENPIDTKDIDLLQKQMTALLAQRESELQAVNTAQSKVDAVSQELANAQAGLKEAVTEEKEKAAEEKKQLDTAKEEFNTAIDSKISTIDIQVKGLEELKKQIEEQKTAVTNTNIDGTALQNNTDDLGNKKASSTANLDTQLEAVKAEISRLNEAKQDIQAKKDGVEGLSKEELESRKKEANAIDTTDKTKDLTDKFNTEKDSFNKESKTVKSTNTNQVEELTSLKTNLNSGVTSFDGAKSTALESNQAQAKKIEEARSSIETFKQAINSERPTSAKTNQDYIGALKKVEEQKQPTTVAKGDGEDNKTHLENITKKIKDTEVELTKAKQLSAEKTDTAVKQKEELDKQTAAMDEKIAELEKLIESKGKEVASKQSTIENCKIDDDKKKTDIDVTKDFQANKVGFQESQDHVNDKNTELSNIKGVDVSNVESLKTEIEELQKNIKQLNVNFEKTTQEAAEAIQTVKQLEANQKGLEGQKATVESEIQEEALKNFKLPEEADLDDDINAVKSKPSIISKDITFKVTASKKPDQEIKISEKSFRAAHARWQGNVVESKRSTFVDNPKENTSGFKLEAADVGREDFSQLNKGADGKIQTNIYNNLLIAQEKLNKTQSIEEAQKIVTECRDAIIGDNSKTASSVGIKNQDEFKESITKATNELETQFKQKAEARQRLEAKLQEYKGMEKKFKDQRGLTPEQETKRTDAINKINERISTINNTLLQNTQGATNTQQQNNTKSRNNAPAQTHNPNVQTKPLSRNNPNNVKSQAHIPKVTEPFKDQVHQPPLGSYQSVANLQSGKSQGQAAGRG